jgi:hypothetical protein
MITDSDTIYRSLTREEHYKIITEAFRMIDVDENGFAVRMKGKKTSTVERDVETIAQTFKGAKIDIKYIVNTEKIEIKSLLIIFLVCEGAVLFIHITFIYNFTELDRNILKTL